MTKPTEQGKGNARRHGATREERAAARRPPEVRSDAMFVQPPTEAYFDRMLLPVDVKILGLLVYHAQGGYCTWVTNTVLSREAGCCVKTIYLSLRRLSQLGWIALEPAPRTERGQVIRLNWRRPAPGKPARPARKPITDPPGNPLPTPPVMGSRVLKKKEEEKEDAARATGRKRETARDRDIAEAMQAVLWEKLPQGRREAIRARVAEANPGLRRWPKLLERLCQEEASKELAAEGSGAAGRG